MNEVEKKFLYFVLSEWTKRDSEMSFDDVCANIDCIIEGRLRK